MGAAAGHLLPWTDEALFAALVAAGILAAQATPRFGVFLGLTGAALLFHFVVITSARSAIRRRRGESPVTRREAAENGLALVALFTAAAFWLGLSGLPDLIAFTLYFATTVPVGMLLRARDRRRRQAQER